VSDSITILRSHGRRLAKAIQADGRMDAYDSAKTFDIAEVAVRGLDDLARILATLATRTDLCVVRGRPVGGSRVNGVRRLFYADAKAGDGPTLQETQHHWIGLDVEGVARPDDVPPEDIAACAKFAIALLPGEFRNVRCIAQATSGHGIKPDIRLRLWFWADRPLGGKALSHWFRRCPVDNSLFRPAQVCYTAAPVFMDGRLDHLPERMAIVPGEPMVAAPEDEALQPPPRPSAPVKPIRVDKASVERRLTAALLSVETASPGQRHHKLRAAARTIGGLMDRHNISASDAENYLLAAARRAAGPEYSEATKLSTIAWGLERGRSEPLDEGGRDGRS
jgi:hypothetical protein